ncbi:NAD(P)-binding protein [Aspergillus fijiensis CBS 313.89]|uniref:NAD(P)-binding protein n=1 Tax=Aspergillus fijiensis CBS 313.89 TaxID=1448319 RepID=A0A8G1RGP1_9EURO|nr:NAD(P)-binding protein [Aspergillus fijiensis CBS 313.89]RAK73522.1 NAD(P)-binding protein [Aspergillus fijiensis CBS 313.89]
MPTIGVFPAAGALGTSTINHLVKLVPASDLILVARKPDNDHLAELARAGATVRRADYEEPSTLDRVFDGVDVLLLISYASIEIQFRFEAHKHAIDAARRSGVKHIFYSSLGFAGDLETSSVAHVMKAHLKTERYLAELQSSSSSSQFTYTAVREGIYSESFPLYTSWFDPHHPADEVAIPHAGDGPGVTWVKRDELGEATAKLVVGYTKSPREFPYLNRVLLLSGPREISLRETVEILGRLVGKPLKIREISMDDYVKLPQHGKKFFYHGIDLTREWATAWDAIRRGETAVVSPLLGQILGREPESFETTVKALYDSGVSLADRRY